jgi:flagellar biosynthesis protein FlhB
VAEEDSDDKTEEATPERRKKAREEGQFPRARDTGGVAASIAVVILLAGTGAQFWTILNAFLRRCFAESLELGEGSRDFVLRELVGMIALTTLPIAAAAAVAGILAGVAEAGYQPNFDLAAPKFERLDPINKIGQLFSPKAALSNTALSLLRVAAVGAVTYWVLKEDFVALTRLSRTPVAAAAEELLHVASRLAVWATVALAVLTAVDYAQSWWRHEKQIRMSLQEIKDEMKMQEGRPEVKARRRARARELLKRGVRKAVKEATVIVTNPTHIAVALRYKASEGAPTVTAKGFDEVAQHIKELARDYDVPIVENKPLARALAAKVKVGKMVPVDLYVAVAEVLAFVFRTRKRGLRG